MIGITLTEACALTNRNRGQLRGMMRRGQLRWMKSGKLVLIHPDDVQALKPQWQGNPVKGAGK